MKTTDIPKKTLRIRAAVIGGPRAQDILIENGRVRAVAPAGRSRPNFGNRNAIFAPTLFDIQVNGGWGIDLQNPDLEPDQIAQLSDKLATQGVARWVPTIITNAHDAMEQLCRTFAEALADRQVRRRIPGIHIEGPYISPEDGPRGAHAREHVRRPNLREFDKLIRAANGHVLYTTIAPELPNALAFIEGCKKRGVRVALGHHNANSAQIRRAVDAGAILSTHLGNGLASMVHRHHNPMWPQLADDRLAISVIADLHHLPPEILRTFVRTKGPKRVVLTSDATHLVGMRPGRYDLAGIPVELTRTGRIQLPGTDLLAGSAHMVLDGVMNATWTTDLSLRQAFAAASTVPARLFHLRYPSLVLQPGRRANFILVDPGATPPTRPLATFIDGELWTANAERFSK